MLFQSWLFCRGSSAGEDLSVKFVSEHARCLGIISRPSARLRTRESEKKQSGCRVLDISVLVVRIDNCFQCESSSLMCGLTAMVGSICL